MGYGDSYIQNTTNTLLRQGDAAADARLRQGAISAQTLGRLGQIASTLPGDIQQAQHEERAKMEIQEAATLAQQFKLPDGQPDWVKVADTLEAKSPMSPVAKEIRTRAQAQQKSLLDAQNMQSEIATREGNLAVNRTAEQRASDKLAFDRNATAQTAATAAKREADIKAVLTKYVDPAKGVITDWSPAIAELASAGFTTEAKQFAELAKSQQPEKVTFGAPTPAQIGGQRVFVRTGSDGNTYDMKGQRLDAEPAPIEPERAPRDQRLVQVMGPNGVPIWVREDQAVGQPAAQAPRAVTGAERQALSFYNRAKDAVDTIKPLETEVAKMGLAGQTKLQYAPNFMQSQLGQQYRQAQRAFTEARLRKESGAAIPNTEFENDAKTYFAQPGDTPETIAQKAQKRDKLLEGLGYSAGKAYEEFYGEPLKKLDAGTSNAAPDFVWDAKAGKLIPNPKKGGGE